MDQDKGQLMCMNSEAFENKGKKYKPWSYPLFNQRKSTVVQQQGRIFVGSLRMVCWNKQWVFNFCLDILIFQIWNDKIKGYSKG